MCLWVCSNVYIYVPHRQRRFGLLVIRKEKKNEGTLILPSKCKSSMMPDWFLHLCICVYAYARKELKMMTVCYYNTGIFLVQIEAMTKRKKYKLGRNFHLYLCGFKEEIWDDQKKNTHTKAGVYWYFNAITNTHFFFFKGNDDVWRLTTVNSTS